MVKEVSSFRVEESPYVHSPAANQHVNLAFNPEAIMHIFPAQVERAEQGQTKSGFERDGIRIYVLREHVAGKNGGIGYTISTSFGIKAVRPEGVVKVNGR